MPLNIDNPSSSIWTEEEIRQKNEVIAHCIREAEDFVRGLEGRCQRDIVILSTSRIDHELELLLRRVIDGNSSIADDRLFNPDRALGTYSARCELCYRLGLLDEGFLRAIRLFGKIRNQFAHHSKDLSLDDSPQKDWLQEIENIVSPNDTNNENGERFRKLREHSFFRFVIPLNLILNLLIRLQYETPQYKGAFKASLVFRNSEE